MEREQERIDYTFMGDNPDAFQIRLLRDARDGGIPVIYFLGVAPGIHQPVLPTDIIDRDARTLKASVAFGVDDASLVSARTATDAQRHGAADAARRRRVRQPRDWVDTAMRRARERFDQVGLDVRMASTGAPPAEHPWLERDPA